MKFDFFIKKSDFFSHNDKKRPVFSSNDQIHIQIVKFEFKRTNQEAPRHYLPPPSASGGSAGGIAQTLVPDLTPAWMVPPSSARQ
jgi:hypothetical protein